MGLLQTGIFYLLVGVAVGAAAYLREGEGSALSRGLRALLVTCFWPLYLPLLLGGPRAATPATSDRAAGPRESERTDPRVQRAAEGLLRGLEQLGDVSAGVLHPEAARIRALSASLHGMSGRLREMDRLLASPEFDAGAARALLAELSTRTQSRSPADGDPRVGSLHTRLRNIERLQTLRDRTAELLERTLLKLEELSSAILLLRFAENPEREVAALVRDLAASVDGLSEGLAATA
jgi:hypothetical protein